MIAATLGHIRRIGAVLFNRKQEDSAAPAAVSLPPVTDWFPPEIDPAYVGFYQRKYSDGSEHDMGVSMPDFWDGIDWRYASACEFVGPVSKHRLPWRGLTEPADVVIPGGGA